MNAGYPGCSDCMRDWKRCDRIPQTGAQQEETRATNDVYVMLQQQAGGSFGGRSAGPIGGDAAIGGGGYPQFAYGSWGPPRDGGGKVYAYGLSNAYGNGGWNADQDSGPLLTDGRIEAQGSSRPTGPAPLQKRKQDFGNQDGRNVAPTLAHQQTRQRSMQRDQDERVRIEAGDPGDLGATLKAVLEQQRSQMEASTAAALEQQRLQFQANLQAGGGPAAGAFVQPNAAADVPFGQDVDPIEPQDRPQVGMQVEQQPVDRNKVGNDLQAEPLRDSTSLPSLSRRPARKTRAPALGPGAFPRRVGTVKTATRPKPSDLVHTQEETLALLDFWNGEERKPALELDAQVMERIAAGLKIFQTKHGWDSLKKIANGTAKCGVARSYGNSKCPVLDRRVACQYCTIEGVVCVRIETGRERPLIVPRERDEDLAVDVVERWLGG